ncbi:CHRromatin Organization modifier domain-containing protein [Podospora aff. communis PSN243]|uniref:CHRromatin Organization modifier domain-containing protein n=1 Tax=Podospora aff. communis PSN243 TaxID=3040156 RepID=A0AAV9GUS2_9PEZI|nr:CHRromatin Organization modifier domain-containing protein [Podospora aff. communis PSN243]
MPYDPNFPMEDFVARVISDVLGSPEPEDNIQQEDPEELVPTVVAIDDDAELAPTAPVADMSLGPEPASSAFSAPKKRGRPSRSASGTPAASAKTARTPKSVKAQSTKATPAAATSGRKRKAPTPEPENEEDEEEKEDDEEEAKPAPAKRGRPARTTAAVASARLAAKDANKPRRGRPKGSGASSTTAKKSSGRGRKAASNGETPAGEYEVERIVDSQIDADTMEHMYLVKWKGYGDDENTWEPKTNLSHAPDLVKAFDAKKKSAGGTKTAAGTEKKRPGRKPKAKT